MAKRGPKKGTKQCAHVRTYKSGKKKGVNSSSGKRRVK